MGFAPHNQQSKEPFKIDLPPPTLPTMPKEFEDFEKAIKSMGVITGEKPTL